MLLPDLITLNNKEMLLAKDSLWLFENAGFTLEEFGENTIRVSGVPEFCVDLEMKKVFLEILTEINSVARTAKQELEEKFMLVLADKVVDGQLMDLHKEDADNLIKELLVLPDAFSSLHGNNVAVKLSKIDIEKKFSRR